jgi:folate-binding protein YgfZ
MNMLAEWKSFLLSSGARFEGEIVRDFGDPDREAESVTSGNLLTDLSYLAVIKISGVDAAEFLNGQFTSDLSRLNDGGVQASAWCNPRGQVIVNMIIVRTGGEFFLLVPREMKDKFISRLRMYVLRAKVMVEDCSDAMPCVGYIHGNNDRYSGIEIERRNPMRERAIQDNGLVMLHIPVNWNRMIMFGPPAVLRAAWLKLAQLYTSSGSHYWQLYDVLDGQPWILNATTETFLPQLLNLDKLQGLSFDKGCFPGQEVIARLHHRGQYKQRLYTVKLDNGAAVITGTRLYNEDQPQGVGTVVNSAVNPLDGQYALVVMNVDYGDPEHLRLADNPARVVQISPPPYMTRH